MNNQFPDNEYCRNCKYCFSDTKCDYWEVAKPGEDMTDCFELKEV